MSWSVSSHNWYLVACKKSDWYLICFLRYKSLNKEPFNLIRRECFWVQLENQIFPEYGIFMHHLNRKQYIHQRTNFSAKSKILVLGYFLRITQNEIFFKKSCMVSFSSLKLGSHRAIYFWRQKLNYRRDKVLVTDSLFER